MLSIFCTYKLIASCYDNLDNIKLAEENYIKAFDNEKLLGAWCGIVNNLIAFYNKHEAYESLCKFYKYLLSYENLYLCHMNKLLELVKQVCN